MSRSHCPDSCLYLALVEQDSNKELNPGLLGKPHPFFILEWNGQKSWRIKKQLRTQKLYSKSVNICFLRRVSKVFKHNLNFSPEMGWYLRGKMSVWLEME